MGWQLSLSLHVRHYLAVLYRASLLTPTSALYVRRNDMYYARRYVLICYTRCYSASAVLIITRELNFCSRIANTHCIPNMIKSKTFVPQCLHFPTVYFIVQYHITQIVITIISILLRNGKYMMNFVIYSV